MKKLLWFLTVSLAIASSLPAIAQQTPDTQVPVTPTPETPAPVTPIPETPAPVTPAPVTPTPQAQNNFGAPRISATSAERNANYITLYTGSQPLSYVTILPPDYINIGEKIEVSDQSGQKIDANVTKEGEKVKISFTQPVQPGSTLNIALMDLAFGPPIPSKSTFNYELAGGYTSYKQDIPYGLAQFQVY
ncbi:DUF2808 domain-containing protein [Nostoc sp. TCL26-01]|uniref:DUF2808 domain-containing protein n=1 Tax=Nostoc sp. TCL26-01 TaxID=2576904 RepID=UPI0015BB1827|nr:DUF2808 domain-containing protein [Nostoc sp. TCL26-01]QLE58780.1 DUF2808 domain-containing protein [Nostoc sp. TCL26-01]